MPSKAKTGKKAKRDVASKTYVRRAINRSKEKKRYHDYLSNQEINTVGFLQNMSDVNQGDGDSDREGNQLRVAGLRLRYFLDRKSTSTGIDVCRVMVFQWKENSIGGNTPLIQDLMSDTLNALPLAFEEPDLGKSVHMLYDKIDRKSVV